jgi:hypothetical protein
MMTSFVNRNLPAIELSLTRQAWEAHRKEAANGDLTPGSRTRTSRAPRWISKRIIDREAYTIEKSSSRVIQVCTCQGWSVQAAISGRDGKRLGLLPMHRDPY